MMRLRIHPPLVKDGLRPQHIRVHVGVFVEVDDIRQRGVLAAAQVNGKEEAKQQSRQNVWFPIRFSFERLIRFFNRSCFRRSIHHGPLPF